MIQKALPLRRPLDMSDKSFKLGLALLAVYVIWGSTYLALALTMKEIPPFLLNGSRFFTAGLVLFITLRMRGTPNPTPRQWRNATYIGIMLMCVANGALAYAIENKIPSGLAALSAAAIPLWAALFASVWYRRPNAAEAFGLVVGIIGVAILNIGNDLWNDEMKLAALALLFSPAVWAYASVYSRRLDLPGGIMNTAIFLMTGGFSLAVAGLLRGERIEQAITLNAFLGWGYLALFGSIIAFSAYTYLLQHASPLLATSYAYVNPVIAVVLGAIFANEALSPQTFLAAALIITAVAIITVQQRPAKTRSITPKVIS